MRGEVHSDLGAPDIQIAYSVKDLLAIQHESLKRIEGKVDEGNLRTAEAVAKLEHRVTRLEERPELEERVRNVEAAQHEQGGERSFKRWLIPFVATEGITLLGVIGALVYYIAHI